MLRPMISKAMKPQSERGEAEPAEIDRPDLRVAELAEPVLEEACVPWRSAGVPRRSGTPEFGQVLGPAPA